MSLSVVVLAAGKGTRMRTGLPKVLHTLAGVTLLERVVQTAQSLNPNKIYVVYGNGGERVRHEMAHLNVHWVEQQEALGTGHAVKQVLPYLQSEEQVLVLYGDVPLITQETLQLLLTSTSKNALGIVIAELQDPTGFGRIVRNEMGNIVKIVEHKDANPLQQTIKEVNTGILTTSAQRLRDWLPRLQPHNAQNEYYLTDTVALAVTDGISVGGVLARQIEEISGVNNLPELSRLERFYQYQKANELMRSGVTIIDPHRFDARGELTIAADVVIDINVILEGQVSIGSNTQIGANSFLRHVTVGENVTILPNCVIEESILEEGCVIGPFARIRPGTCVGRYAKIGNFVEMKNTQMGEGSKVPHLSYVGDTKMGKQVNLGAGTITVNYDGANKHQTIIEDGAFVGCDSQLIAPVTIGAGAYIGAGSTITAYAPSGQLTLSRAKQTTIPGWKPKIKKESP